jgi:hypothetical protein
VHVINLENSQGLSFQILLQLLSLSQLLPLCAWYAFVTIPQFLDFLLQFFLRISVGEVSTAFKLNSMTLLSCVLSTDEFLNGAQ